MVQILTDEDIARELTPERAIAWMREALVAQHHGELHAPPRAFTELGDGRLVFTTGSLDGSWFGYRSYDTFGREPGEQVVVVHDAGTGRVRGIAVGNELGPRRVGAIGGVAADVLAPRAASSLAILGTGVQAWEQLRAIDSVRDLTDIRVYSRGADGRRAFAERAGSDLGLDVYAAPDPQRAVEGADMVVLATSSATPVVEPAWLAASTYVTTLGPKQVGRAEFGPALVAACDAAFTDSLAQITAYEPPNILVGTPQEHRLGSLGAVLADEVVGRSTDEERILFCSVGLAGTETFLLDRLVG